MARHSFVTTDLSTHSKLKVVVPWGVPQIAGRLVELSGEGATAALTAAFGLVLETQWRGEPVAWITLLSSTFFPPDAAASGIDLDSLAVVRARDAGMAARAASQLVRSGGFGLVAIDLGPKPAPSRMGQERVESTSISMPLLTRLVGLAKKHDTAVVVLTEKPTHASSLGSLVSLRAHVRRPPAAPYRIELLVLKDKRRGPGQVHRETCRGPAGMC